MQDSENIFWDMNSFSPSVEPKLLQQWKSIQEAKIGTTAALLELYCEVGDAPIAPWVQHAISISRGERLPRNPIELYTDTVPEQLGIEQPMNRYILPFDRSNFYSRNEVGQVWCLGECL